MTTQPVSSTTSASTSTGASTGGSTGASSAALAARETRRTTGVVAKREIALVRGRGATLWDAEGRSYVDCAAGHGVASIGHAHPRLAAALAEQAGRLITCSESFPNDRRAELLDALVALLPAGLERLFLCNSGTEAVEAALKFARLATGRSEVVACMRGFHGRTMGALSATWEKHYREPFAPLVPGVKHAPYDRLDAAEAAIDERTACVLVELVQGEGGVRPASRAYVEGLRALCDERGALLVVDEVQTGFGRTGRWFACEHHALVPDVLCLGKALAGGLPMGAVAVGPRVQGFAVGLHGSTFGGNPLVCAAAATTLAILREERLVERAAVLGNWLQGRLRAIDAPVVRETRGLGLMAGLELRVRVAPLVSELLEQGVIALPAGPSVLRLLPPLCIPREDLERACDTIERVLRAARPAADEESAS